MSRPAVFPVIQWPRTAAAPLQSPPDLLLNWHTDIPDGPQTPIKSTNPCVKAPRQNPPPPTFFGYFFFNDKYGSLQQRGLTWDINVSSFMIREFTPVPLSRRNVRLFHQESPRHAQLGQYPYRLSFKGSFVFWRSRFLRDVIVNQKLQKQETQKLRGG